MVRKTDMPVFRNPWMDISTDHQPNIKWTKIIRFARADGPYSDRAPAKKSFRGNRRIQMES